jgi:intein/homing endonuclease
MYTEDDCIDAVKRATERLGHEPTITEYREMEISPSYATITRKLGSWPEAIECAGGEHTLKTVTKDDVIDDLQYIADLKDREPVRNDLDEIDDVVSITPVYEYFDSLYDAKEAAGINTDASTHRRSVTEGYFKEIDTAEKAYWLGFLFGDGSINNKRVHLRVQNGDEDHLRKFRNTIDSDATVTEAKSTVEFSVCKKKFRSYLRNHGFTESKTKDDSLPQLHFSLRPHFIRGLFDADGCADIEDGRRRWRITSASEERLEKIYSWLTEIGVQGGGVYPNRTWYELCISNQSDIGIIVNHCYPNGTDTKPSLMRKTEKLVITDGKPQTEPVS